MAISQVPPLSYNVPIVYPKGHPSEGCPTPAFQALIQILLEEKAVTDGLAEGAAPGTRVISAGTGLTGGGDLTADRTISLDTTAEAERIRDVIGTALVAGSNVTITVDDAGDTITIAASGGGGGGRTLIAETAADGATTTFTFSSIPATYDSLELDIYFEAAGKAITLRFNNDSGSNYQTQRMGVQNGAINEQLLAQTSLAIGAAAASAGSHDFEQRTMILGYANTGTTKMANTRQSYNRGTGSGNVAVSSIAGMWNSTAAINRIDVVCDVAPSAGKIRLFGVS